MASQVSQWPSGWSGWGAVLGAGEVPPQGPVTGRTQGTDQLASPLGLALGQGLLV